MIDRMIAVADLALNFIFGFLNLPFQVPHWLGFFVLLLIGVAFAFALRAPRWLNLAGFSWRPFSHGFFLRLNVQTGPLPTHSDPASDTSSA
jgi:hypothetical protein